MRRHALALAAILVVAALCGGCGKTPTETYQHMVAAAKLGDTETFLNHFTKESKSLIEALIRLSETYGFERNSPYRLLVMDRVLSEEMGEEPLRDGQKRRTATLLVQSGQKRRKIKMVEVDGKWLIDAVDLEQFWLERKNFNPR